MVHFFHEGGGPYLKEEKSLTPSSISNTGLIDGVPPLSANGPLRFIRIIYMGQAHKSNTKNDTEYDAVWLDTDPLPHFSLTLGSLAYGQQCRGIPSARLPTS